MQIRTLVRHLRPLFFFALMAVQTGCAIVGNIKPVEEKSESYGVLDLSKANPEWIKLDPASESFNSKDVTPTELADVAYQSSKTASIISLNSACRSKRESNEKDLKALTNLLFLGISDISLQQQRELTVQNSPALETTIVGKLNGEDMMLETVVVRRGACIYDLVYMSRPAHFEQNLPDFAHFVASLRLK